MKKTITSIAAAIVTAALTTVSGSATAQSAQPTSFAPSVSFFADFKDDDFIEDVARVDEIANAMLDGNGGNPFALTFESIVEEAFDVDFDVYDEGDHFIIKGGNQDIVFSPRAVYSGLDSKNTQFVFQGDNAEVMVGENGLIFYEDNVFVDAHDYAIDSSSGDLDPVVIPYGGGRIITEADMVALGLCFKHVETDLGEPPLPVVPELGEPPLPSEGMLIDKVTDAFERHLNNHIEEVEMAYGELIEKGVDSRAITNFDMLKKLNYADVFDSTSKTGRPFADTDYVIGERSVQIAEQTYDKMGVLCNAYLIVRGEGGIEFSITVHNDGMIEIGTSEVVEAKINDFVVVKSKVNEKAYYDSVTLASLMCVLDAATL